MAQSVAPALFPALFVDCASRPVVVFEMIERNQVARFRSAVPWGEDMGVQILVDRDQIAEFCHRHRIRKLAFFGSVLRDDFGPDSDVDVLVEFEPGQVVGLRLIRMQEELSRLLGGLKVDLVTPKFLNRRIRDRVLAEAEVQYAQG